jgi:hypothetical protein
MPKLVIKNVRFSYCNLTTPKVPLSGGEPKYSCTILVPKVDVEAKRALDKAIAEAIEEGVKSKWSGVRPPFVALPIHDGDGARPSDGMPYGDECKGHWVFTASSKDAPQLVDRALMPILSPSDIYSGMYGNVSISVYPYFNSGKKGIGIGLNNVMKTAEGEALAGRSSAASDFAGLGEPGSFDYQPLPEFTPQPAPWISQPPQPQYGTRVPTQIQYDLITGQPIKMGGV